MATKPGAKKLIKGTPKTLLLSLPIANDRTNKKSSAEINGEKMPTYMRWLALSYASTMAIPCAWALPCGLDHKNMPFGIQLIAPAGRDAQLSEIAKSLETILMSNEETKRPIPKL